MRYSILIILLFASLLGKSQDLANTTWKVYDTEFLVFYAQFSDDIVSLSFDEGLSYQPTSDIEIVGSNLSITDLDLNGGCEGVTGEYTFSILNDELVFTVIEDLCESRLTAFTEFDWIACPTGIEDLVLGTDIRLFPNPAISDLIIESDARALDFSYRVMDIGGRQVLSGIFNSDRTMVDISRLESGIYSVMVDGLKDQKALRFIKE